MAVKSFFLDEKLVDTAWNSKILLSGGRHIVSFIFLLLQQFVHPCCSVPRTHLFTKILGEKLGYDNDYDNANVNI